jgi:hypothetical protein
VGWLETEEVEEFVGDPVGDLVGRFVVGAIV